jgi:ESCRT-I complex subunit TSG101
LRAQQAAITTSLNAINKEISQLADLESLLCSNEAILHQAMRDADKVLEDAKRRKVPNVDEVLVAPTVVAGQLYELVADERSLEESRAVVGRALDKGRIGGDVWAKVRILLSMMRVLRKC